MENRIQMWWKRNKLGIISNCIYMVLFPQSLFGILYWVLLIFCCPISSSDLHTIFKPNYRWVLFKGVKLCIRLFIALSCWLSSTRQRTCNSPLWRLLPCTVLPSMISFMVSSLIKSLDFPPGVYLQPRVFAHLIYITFS